jgi:hypothetical protein
VKFASGTSSRFRKYVGLFCREGQVRIHFIPNITSFFEYNPERLPIPFRVVFLIELNYSQNYGNKP